eukprot:1150332-Amphidinium_carterae.1
MSIKSVIDCHGRNAAQLAGRRILSDLTLELAPFVQWHATQINVSSCCSFQACTPVLQRMRSLAEAKGYC